MDGCLPARNANGRLPFNHQHQPGQWVFYHQDSTRGAHTCDQQLTTHQQRTYNYAGYSTGQEETNVPSGGVGMPTYVQNAAGAPNQQRTTEGRVLPPNQHAPPCYLPYTKQRAGGAAAAMVIKWHPRPSRL